MDEARNWVQLGALFVGIVGGLLAAFRGIYEMRQSTRQRYADLRWKRANAARELVSDIHHDQRAAAAVLMMDWSEGAHEHDLGAGRREMLSYSDVVGALAKPASECREARERYVRDCFDWFFYYVDRIEHYIETGLIEFIDVASIFKPYILVLRKSPATYDQFVATRGYELVPRFLARYGSSV
jgi:hypothetical protein